MNCKSVTPIDDGAIGLLAKTLEGIGFKTTIHNIGEGSEQVTNLYATYGESSTGSEAESSPRKNFCFAGHTDVVPIGKNTEHLWKHDPFSGEVVDGTLFGRGAVDMKGSIACFVAAVHKLVSEHPNVGMISFLITGDEEASGKNGTKELLKLVPHKIDYCIVGEPTSENMVVDNIKIGRRGSVNFTLKIAGKQGHVAYPEKVVNPINSMIEVLNALKNYEFNDSSEYFQSTALAITSVDVGNTATNVVPNEVGAKFNVRTSSLMPSEELIPLVTNIIEGTLEQSQATYELGHRVSGESFLSNPTTLLENSVNAIIKVVGQTPNVTTLGGTSDARFIKDYCTEMLEIGPKNSTAHQVNECIEINDLEILTEIYYNILYDTLIA